MPMTIAFFCRCFILLLLFPSPSGWAQEGPEKTGENRRDPAVLDPQPPPLPRRESAAGLFLRDIWKDQKAIWTGPFRMHRKQFLTIALPLTAASAALIATDEQAAKWLPNTQGQMLWSGRVSRAGAFYTLGGLVGGTMIAGSVKHRPDLYQLGRLSAEAFADSIIVNYALKGMTARERPDQNDGQGRFWKGGMSFPSGHAMNTWAVATAVARNPKCPKWLAVTSYGVAVAVSLSRWGARKHFPSDIFVGGVFGGLIGNYVATRPR